MGDKLKRKSKMSNDPIYSSLTSKYGSCSGGPNECCGCLYEYFEEVPVTPGSVPPVCDSGYFKDRDYSDENNYVIVCMKFVYVNCSNYYCPNDRGFQYTFTGGCSNGECVPNNSNPSG